MTLPEMPTEFLNNFHFFTRNKSKLRENSIWLRFPLHTQNWSRSEDEVSIGMELVYEFHEINQLLHTLLVAVLNRDQVVT